MTRLINCYFPAATQLHGWNWDATTSLACKRFIAQRKHKLQMRFGFERKKWRFGFEKSKVLNQLGQDTIGERKVFLETN